MELLQETETVPSITIRGDGLMDRVVSILEQVRANSIADQKSILTQRRKGAKKVEKPGFWFNPKDGKLLLLFSLRLSEVRRFKMVDLTFQPVTHEHVAFLENAKKREGFKKAYEDLEEEYALVREMLAARARVGLSQEAVAERMGTTKSAISRLEAAGKHAPSVTSLKKYAHAVGAILKLNLFQIMPDATV